MLHQRGVNFLWRNFFAASIDDFFETARKKQVTVRIEKTLVAGPKPATDERIHVGVGVALVTSNDVASPNDDFPDFARRSQNAVIAHDGDLGTCCDSRRRSRPGPRRQLITGDLPGGFGHSVRIHHRHTEDTFEVVA